VSGRVHTILRLALLASIGLVAPIAARAPEPDAAFCRDDAAAVERRVDDLLAQMTLDEKIEQMHGSGFSDGMWRTPANERLGLPGFGMLDGPRGVSLLAGEATSFPVAAARGATWDPALEERVGEAIGAEMRAKGASVLLAPTLNLLRHPRWGRAQETYGEDPLQIGRMGVGFIRGAQRHVVATAKHYALNSIEDTRLVVDVRVDERTLREIYLPHFRMAVQEGHVGAVMAAYNKVNGQYCAENYHLLHEILKDDWGFPGFVMSDWFVGTRSTLISAWAGLDVEMPVPVYYGDPLEASVEGGAVPPWVVDEAVRRILRTMLCFRLDSDPPVPAPDVVQSPAHLDLALEVARKSIVLLRNAGATLPLDGVASLAVVGDQADTPSLGDTGSSVVTPSFAISPLEGIRARARGTTVTHVAGPPLAADDRTAVAAADAAIVFVSLGSADEGEGSRESGDRFGLGLAPEQDALIAEVAALNPRTVVVLEGGSAITMPWLDDVGAVLMAWYPGQLGGEALGDILFGDVNPSGRLPVSFPRAEADLPPFDNRNIRVPYGYFHGYRWLDRRGVAPLFPFGFGLSYTTFAYTNLVLSSATLPTDGRLTMTVDVTNTGGMAGDTVVQLYVGARGSRVERARRELRDFARVHLDPGETRTVALGVAAADLAYWDRSRSAWVVEPIVYEVRVGSSSRDLPLRDTVAVVRSSPPTTAPGDDQASSDGARRCSRSTASRYSCTRS
jgi:beta-glucosidase